MIKYRKKILLAKAGEPFFIRHKATESHNEITVAIVTYAVPLNTILPHGSDELSPAMWMAVHKAVSSFQDFNLEFNKNPQMPALLFKVKAKTERRGKDVPNQELADKMVMSKANIKACTIAKKIVDSINDYLLNIAKTMTPIAQVLENYIDRESFYFRKKVGLFK